MSRSVRLPATQTLTIELDESIRKHEEQFLLEARRRMSLSDEFRYHWRRRNEEPLLWVADAVAWSYVQGGDWAQQGAAPAEGGIQDLNARNPAHQPPDGCRVHFTGAQRSVHS